MAQCYTGIVVIEVGIVDEAFLGTQEIASASHEPGIAVFNKFVGYIVSKKMLSFYYINGMGLKAQHYLSHF